MSLIYCGRPKKEELINILLRLIMNKENRKHVTNIIVLQTESVIQ